MTPTATKEKAWKAPKGWEEIERSGEDDEILTSTRTYPDGTSHQIVAHSEDEFTTLAAANDADVQRRQARMHADLKAEAAEYRRLAKEKDTQAKQYEWAV